MQRKEIVEPFSVHWLDATTRGSEKKHDRIVVGPNKLNNYRYCYPTDIDKQE